MFYIMTIYISIIKPFTDDDKKDKPTEYIKEIYLWYFIWEIFIYVISKDHLRMFCVTN